MKTLPLLKWLLSLALAMSPLANGCARKPAAPAPAPVAETPLAVPPVPAAPAVPTPEVAERELANAPAKLVSQPQPAAQGVALDPAAAELVRLTQSSVDEKVMLAYVNNSARPFNLGSEQIIYLNDIGVPSSVVTAMIQRDQALNSTTVAPPTVMQPAPVPAPPVIVAPPVVTVAATAPSPQVNVTSTYFYDSLSPYGNWLEVEGYGRVWQPATVVTDREWTPYVNRGHWVYSDCGWYWASDYSWGWAPFHYGRWFRHSYWGWCWAPDTVWGPSWVSWRYNSGYCGWAPLPPTACYRPGAGFTYYGRSVGVSFEFGLGADCYTFVAANRFCDARPYQHRLPHHEVTQIFNSTVIINPVVEDHGNPRFHRGIPSKHIADVSHVEINQVKIQESPHRPEPGRGDKQEGNRGGTLTVFKPVLPLPPLPSLHLPGQRIGEGIKAATPETVIPRGDTDNSKRRGIPTKTHSPEVVRPTVPQPVVTVPATQPKPMNPSPNRPTDSVRKEPVTGNQPHRIIHETLTPPVKSGTAETPPTRNNWPNIRPVQPTTQPTTVQPVVRPEAPAVQPTYQPTPTIRLPRPVKGSPREVTMPTPPPVQSLPPVQSQPVVAPTFSAPREGRGNFNPTREVSAPVRIPAPAVMPPPRVVAPPVSVPRVEAPQNMFRPVAPAPAPAAPVSAPRNDGGQRDKHSDGKNSPRKQ